MIVCTALGMQRVIVEECMKSVSLPFVSNISPTNHCEQMGESKNGFRKTTQRTACGEKQVGADDFADRGWAELAGKYYTSDEQCMFHLSSHLSFLANLGG